MKILIVEDNKDLIDALKAFLEGIGHEEIIIANDGQEGIDKHQSNRDIDLIISDINMPKMLGPDMALKIRENGYKKDIVFLSTDCENHMDKIKACGSCGEYDKLQMLEMIEKHCA